jgi:ribosome production factor 2
MEAREPKEIEDPRIAIFVKGTHAGEVVNSAMKELVCSIRRKFQLYTNVYTVMAKDGPETT